MRPPAVELRWQADVGLKAKGRPRAPRGARLKGLRLLLLAEEAGVPRPFQAAAAGPDCAARSIAFTELPERNSSHWAAKKVALKWRVTPVQL